MSDDKKPKETTPKKAPTETKAVETKAVEAKAVEAKAETPTTESKPDAAPKKQGMGEGQKPVSQAYKDNWNDIFGKRKSDSARPPRLRKGSPAKARKPNPKSP